MALDYFWDETQLNLGGLAAGDVISAGGKCDAAREQGFRFVESEYLINVRDKPTNVGPIVFGVAMDQVAADVEECIEADPQSRLSSQDEANMRAARMVMPLGLVGHGTTDGAFALRGTEIVKYAGGKGWSIPEGGQMSFWAWVPTAGVTLTGATIIDFMAKHKGVWLRD